MSQQNAPRTYVASRVLADGRLVELLYAAENRRTALAVHASGQTTLVDEVEGPGGERLVPLPASNSLIKHGALLFPERPETYGVVPDLVAEIERYFDRYVALSPWFRRLAAYYVLFTWVYDAFEELPYLRVQAEWGSGKTRALIVIGSLCHRAFFASGASTVSPIFHTLDTFRGTLILDEADFRFSDQTAELTKILNNGNVRGFPVFRTAFTNKREFDPRAFQVFGPKLVAMRKSFDDEALESRFITERLDRTRMLSGIPINLPASQRTEAQALRNKLLQYRFDHRLSLRADENCVDPALSHRTNQILVPLLSIIPDESARADIRAALRALEDEGAKAKSTTVEADILEVLIDLSAVAGGKPIAIGDITSRFIERRAADYDRPITSRYVGGVLRGRLGLATYKTHGSYVVAVDTDRLSALSVRYGLVAKYST